MCRQAEWAPPGAPWQAATGLSTLHNGMIAPLGDYGLRGMLWYQGESNTFEADAYAVAQTNGTDLASALLKLYTDNASTLTPDPVYARFYYSHPPASERLSRLQAAA